VLACWNEILTKVQIKCTNLCIEYCERFQLIFLLPRICLLNTHSSFTSHNFAHTLNVFVICPSFCRKQRGSLLTIARPSRNLLCHSQTFVFFIAALSYAYSSIRNLSEGDLYSKARKFIFAYCYIADILKCDKPAILRNKQIADT
jgi:hypothetical protein